VFLKTKRGEAMNEEMVQQMMAAAERLAAASEALDRVLGRLDAQQETLNAKVDRIVAAVEESVTQTAGRRTEEASGFEQRVAELEKSNADLKAQAARLARKTLSPVVSALLAKNEIEGERYDAAVLDKTLAALSVEQRIAVKAEMARAGMIE
jgi:predicted RNase H-like nuclease (RuvC/YqgF family)